MSAAFLGEQEASRADDRLDAGDSSALRLILRQVGAASLGISDMAYDGGAWFSWRTQAATLCAALAGGA